MYQSHSIKNRGVSFIELLVTIAVMSLVFGGLMASLQYVMKLITSTKMATSALSLANERIEYVRSLSYNAVGTVGGIPSGLLPQHATTSMNGVTFHERLVIQYKDSPDDGEGAADTNGILADYKEVKVEYSWNDGTGTSTLFLLTNVVPPGIESTLGGGTLTVNVFDANVLPVSGAEVHIYNNTGTSTIDTIRYTNVNGTAVFAGAPALASYEITVSGVGYSVDATYAATTSNPNPVTPHAAVIESDVSTLDFQIDRLSDLLIRTVGPAAIDTWSDTFVDISGLSTSTDTQVVSDALTLSGTSGSYVGAGSARSAEINPAAITEWETVMWDASVPLDTTLTVQVYAVTGVDTYTLVPDTDLPNNSTGYSTSGVDIRGLSVATYPRIALGASLGSTNPLVTPELLEWSVSYVVSEPAVASVPFTIRGNKTIGSTVSLAPIYKYMESLVTDGSGEYAVNDIEWDVYTVTLDTSTHDISEACEALPYSLAPGVSETLTLTLVPNAAHTVRVHVVDSTGDAIQGAEVTLSRPAYSENLTTSSCGQTFFSGGVASEADYELDVTASGYVSQTVTPFEVDGDEVVLVTLAEV